MPSVFQRHPRYSLFSGFLLLATFLLLASQHAPPPPVFIESFTTDGLQHRIANAERTYQRMLQDRQGLIHKFGPTADKVMMFPPDTDPWPPYTVWDFIPAAFNCPHTVERVGALGDGGKWVCGLERVSAKPDCVVYSIGINHESSFEAELLARTAGCEVWGYDFSVDAFGPEVQRVPSLLRRAHFAPFGLAGADAHGPDDAHKMYTLASLMRRNGHRHIDILKVDIESWEFETLRALLKVYLDAGEPLPFGQLQLEIHVWGKKFSEFIKWWEMLEEAGLRPFWTEPNMVYQNYNRGGSADLAEYSFINIKGENAFITDQDHFRPVHGARSD
ncbi:methyltransferase domain-containing protein [Phellopilus nigrolimitatus]|nr:methyltransferase domain-containing protein [Phellopilus nigrolimitatus]